MSEPRKIPADWVGVVPRSAIDMEEVMARFPAVRQSLLASFDDCELGALFKLKYENGWSTHPQARGTIMHRAISECLRVMREQDSEGIPVGAALEILEETLYQRNVPPEDIVRVPLRELPMMEMAMRKFAKDNSFTIRNIIDVERRLSAELTYEGEDGLVTRTLTGQIDALIAAPPDEAIVLDWKDTWALPPKRHEDAEDPGVSYHGYFQQLFYAWLVMKSYPAIQAVTLREFYIRRTQARPARVTRNDLDKVEQRLRYLVASFDRAVALGEPKRIKRVADLEKHGAWKASPGKHCFWCAKASRCPIDDDFTDGRIRTPEDAARAAATRQVASSVRKRLTDLLMPWVELHGPIPLKSAKGRRVLGFRKIKGGVRFEEYTPDSADRPGTEATEAAVDLEAAMKSATERAKAERDAARKARRAA